MNEEKLVESFIRGFSKPLILWLICLKPMHGYNLIKEFKHITGKRLKPAVIYPFLHALEEKGYVVGTWMSRGKRKIKRYSVTQKGKTLLASIKKHITMPNLADPEYIKARDKYNSELGMKILFKGLAVDIKDEQGNIVEDEEKKFEILKGLGMSGEQFSQIIEDITSLTKWGAEEQYLFFE